MDCQREQKIKIFRGDDTNWNGENLLNFVVTSETVDLSTMTAKFIVGSIMFDNIPLTTGEFTINFTHQQTATMPWGLNKGVLQILDADKRIKTITNAINLFVTSEPIFEESQTINVTVPEGSEIQIGLQVGIKYVTYEEFEQTVIQLNNEINKKVSKSGDFMTGPLSFEDFSISSGDGMAKIEGAEYGLRVDTTTGLGASLATVGGRGSILTSLDVKSTYSPTGIYPVNGQAVASAISTKQDIISDLSTIRSGAALGATAVQPATMEDALSTKQDALTTTQMQAVDSGANSTNIAQIATNTSDISVINSKIPNQASSTNQLADKEFVNSSISTNTANFIGTFENLAALEAYSGTVTNNDYAFVVNSVITDNGDDWATFAALDVYNKALLTNFDYAWVVNGSKFDLYRFDIILQAWDLRAENIHKTDVSLNTAYNRYKASVVSNVVTWDYEYTLNNSSFTAAQWAAINSGITSGDVTLIQSALQPNDNISSLTNDAHYVTTTDYATTDTGGVVKVSTSGGTQMNGSGVITTYRASDTDIDGKTNAYKVIVPRNLDYAVKMGITDNANTLTDAEKLAARAWIGANTADGITIEDSSGTISTVAVKEQKANAPIKEWVGTKSEYDSIVSKDSNTLYIVTDESAGGGIPTLTWYSNTTGSTVTISDTTSAQLVKVYKNGLLLEPTADYSISGTTLTLVTPLVSTDKITTEVF